MKSSHSVIAALIICAAIAGQCAAASYTITNFGNIGARSISNSGQVLLQAPTPNNTPFHYWMYDGGSMTDLGSLGPHSNPIVADMNNNLDIAAIYLSSAAGKSFIRDYPSGAITEMGPIAGGFFVTLSGINDAGDAVGSYDAPGPDFERAFVFHNGAIQNLGTLGGDSSSAVAINSHGYIVGNSTIAVGSDVQRAFLYDGTGMHNLGVLPGYLHSKVTDINDAGVVVGYLTNDLSAGPQQGFRFVNGSMEKIDAPGGIINVTGQIVGTLPLSGGTFAPYLFENDTTTNLNSLIDPASGWVLSSVRDINDLGQIIGSGTFNGQPSGFMLTPVPEPSSFVLAALGLLILTALHCRRRQRS